MIVFELLSGFADGKKILTNLDMCLLAISLEGCETLIQHPASRIHSCVPRDRLATEITDELVRMSVGLESAEDVIADLEQTLDCLV
jgi:methionine-gamma-lyase